MQTDRNPFDTLRENPFAGKRRRCLFCGRRMTTAGLELVARNREVVGHPGVHPYLGDVHMSCYLRSAEEAERHA